MPEAPIVQAQMLIRATPETVFQAFADPAITTPFWFSRASGPLEPGARVRWDWEHYGASTELRVLALEPPRRILIEWDEPPCPVEWRFEARTEGTLVTIRNWGFRGDAGAVAAQAIDAMGGFTMVLAGAKALLEHGIRLDLVADHHPEGHVDRAAPAAQGMAPRLSLVTLGVDELERALRFYRDGLGLPSAGIVGRELEHGAVAFFELQAGLRLALWPRASLAHDSGLRVGAGAADVCLAHNVASPQAVDVLLERALAAGARLVKPAARTFWGGYAGYFQDPDGHLWEVACPTPA